MIITGGVVIVICIIAVLVEAIMGVLGGNYIILISFMCFGGLLVIIGYLAQINKNIEDLLFLQQKKHPEFFDF